jgi:uncharacterized membrane protein YvlD (DUF360 family)
MDPILQTLTLAIILLIAGIICMVIGVVGLVWKTDTTGGGWKKSIFRQSWGKTPIIFANNHAVATKSLPFDFSISATQEHQ